MTTKNELYTQIARQHLGIETLEERKMDSQDFHEVAVWQVEKALQAAYRAGQAELLAAAEALVEERKTATEQIGHYQRLAQCWQGLRRAIRNAENQNALPKP